MAATHPPAQEPAAPHGAVVALLTFLAYVAVAAVVLALTDDHGRASTLFPSAGIALAATLVYGRPALLGVCAAAVAVSLGVAEYRGHGTSLLPWVVASGTALQTWVGAALVRRYVQQPLVLQVPRDIFRAGALGALLACVVSASVATAALWMGGHLPTRSLQATWLAWWLGDSMGVLIGGPLTLTLIGRPVPTGGRACAHWACRCWRPWSC